MTYATQESVAATLTQGEMGAKATCYRTDIVDHSGVLAPPPADGEPVPRPSRLPIEWDGMEWVEVSAPELQ